MRGLRIVILIAVLGLTGCTATAIGDSAAVATEEETKAAELDQSAIAWFERLCFGIASASQMDESYARDVAPIVDLALRKEGLVDLLTTVIVDYSSAATTLELLPAPEFPGGQAFASTFVSRMREKVAVLDESVKEFSATGILDADRYDMEEERLWLSAMEILEPLAKVGELEPAIVKGVASLPPCLTLAKQDADG